MIFQCITCGRGMRYRSNYGRSSSAYSLCTFCFDDFTSFVEKEAPYLLSFFALLKLKINANDDFSKRVKAGLAKSKENGIRLGRPPKYGSIVIEDVHKLRKEGISFRQIDKRLGIGKNSAFRIVKQQPNQ